MSISVEDGLHYMGLIEDLFDGTPATIGRMRYLVQVLTSRPDDFLEEFIATADTELYLADVEAGAKLLAELGPNPTHGQLRYAVDLELRRIAALAASIAVGQ